MATASRAAIGTEEINPNNREDTPVVAGLGNRSQIREELPLSTRVHELAKELGLKSQELLERIQKWGLDVKANALASLDPPMVDRIRELMDQPAAGKEVDELPLRPLNPRPRRRSRVAGIADGCVPPRPARRSAGAPARPEPDRLRLARPRPSRQRAADAGPAASAAVAADRGSSAIDPRLVPLRIGPTPGVDRAHPRPAYAQAGHVRPRLAVSRGPAGSPRWLFRNPARRLAPFRPIRRIAARARGPAARRLPDKARDTSPEPVSLRPASLVARSGRIRLSTVETRRLHVVGGNPPDDPAGRSLRRPLRQDRVAPVERSEAIGRRRRITEDTGRPLPNVAAATTPPPRAGGPQRSASAASRSQDAAPGKVGDQGGNAGLDEVGSARTLPISGWPRAAPARGLRGGQPQRGAGPSPGPAAWWSHARRRFRRATSGCRTRMPVAGAAPPMTAAEEEEEKKQDRPARLGRRSRRPPRPTERAGRRSPRHLAGPRRRTPRG